MWNLAIWEKGKKLKRDVAKVDREKEREILEGDGDNKKGPVNTHVYREKRMSTIWCRMRSISLQPQHSQHLILIHTSLCHIFFIANETHIDIYTCEEKKLSSHHYWDGSYKIVFEQRLKHAIVNLRFMYK